MDNLEIKSTHRILRILYEKYCPNCGAELPIEYKGCREDLMCPECGGYVAWRVERKCHSKGGWIFPDEVLLCQT